MTEKGNLADILLNNRLSFEQARDALTPAGIVDPIRAHKNLQLLAGRDAEYEAFREILPDVIQSLGNVADPDLALNNWERLVGMLDDRKSHFAHFAERPAALSILLQIIGASQYLADILIRGPHLIHDVLENGEWQQPTDAETLNRELDDLPGWRSGAGERVDLLREFKQHHMLAIGARDICGVVDVEQTLQETTALADACVRAAFEMAESEIRSRFGKATAEENSASTEASSVVIAFGKLGGKELNYSSDIDLMFMYSHDGVTVPPADKDSSIGSISNREYFSKLAEKCIDILARVTDRGHLFRVDMRLRPMGSEGPLVSSLESHISYYEIFGEAWERQALLKARPIAGDIELALRFLEEIRPFVYPKYLDHAGIRDIQELKRRIELQVDREGRTHTEVKLGRGGIRDIEFAVQFLQLLNGGKHPELRSPNTLEALRSLEKIGYFSRKECEAFVEAYRFLRRTENRLQIMQNRQLHTLPSRTEEVEALARSLGYRPSSGITAGAPFEKAYRKHTQEVRQLFDKFFGDMFADTGRASPVVDLIQKPEPTEYEIEDVLGQYGFRDCAGAFENLRLLAEGSNTWNYSPRARNFFCSIAPLLLRHLAQSPDPDMALNNLQRCIAALGAPSTFYEILSSNPKSIELLVALSSYSDHLIRLLVNDPGVIDFLLSTRILEEESSKANIDKALGKFLEINPTFFYESIQRFKNGELLRIGLRDILGLADIAEVTRELSSVADVMLSRMYDRCLEEHVARYGLPTANDGSPSTMAILGMGKLGGREINYASDLDVFFVYSSEGLTAGGTSEPVTCQQFFAMLAADLMKKMSELNRYGYLYKMDARLRPDGSQGLLAVSVDTFKDYHTTKSAHWEKLAMTRLRPVAGDMALGERITNLTHSLIYAPDFFTSDVVAGASQLLRKIFEASQNEDHGGVEIKNAEGGIIEIEFLVQLLLLRYGPGDKILRTTNTLEAIGALREKDCIKQRAHDDLVATFVLLRRVENRLRLMHNRSLSELPRDIDALNKLALRLGITSAVTRNPGEALLDMLESYINRSHRVTEEQLDELKRF